MSAVQAPRGERVLVIAHRHPDFSKGGGEIAAYALYRAAREHPGVEGAWFVASAERGRGPTGHLSIRRVGEYLWEQGTGDWRLLKAAQRRAMLDGFADLVRALRPTVVHAHHYAHLGIELFGVIKQVDPSIRVILTLHEFLAICHNNGQMVKTGAARLCHRESPDDCHGCFPQQTPEDFWLRKHFIQSHLRHVDVFVSPSHFLRDRYRAWGIPDDRIVVIENVQPPRSTLPPRDVEAGMPRARFGYFGQLNPYKGIDLLLEAIGDLPRKRRREVRLEIHGANLDVQTGEFRDRIAKLAAPLVDEGVVQWRGAYEPWEVAERMRGIDWVVMPSIWWENSPMVIQEALACGRPLLVSGIGGMAEKVRPGVDGLHVQAGSRAAWTECLTRVVQDERLWHDLRDGIARAPQAGDVVKSHFALWRSR